jgi:hypothetical protein
VDSSACPRGCHAVTVPPIQISGIDRAPCSAYRWLRPLHRLS